MKRIILLALLLVPLTVNASYYGNNLHDGYGNPISSLGASINTHDADVHTDMINRHFLDFDTVTENPSSGITKGDTVILVASTTGFIVADDIVIKDASGLIHEQHLTITAVSTDASITVDRPIDLTYTTSATLEEVSHNLNASGTLASPVIYEVFPASDEVWHVERLLISITDNTTGQCDDSKFGMITALTHGLVLRENKNSGADLKTISVWKANTDMKQDMYDVICSPSAPAGFEGLSGRFTFKSSGSIIKLDGAQGDKLELLVQDTLTGVVSIHVKVQAHKEGN